MISKCEIKNMQQVECRKSVSDIRVFSNEEGRQGGKVLSQYLKENIFIKINLGRSNTQLS